MSGDVNHETMNEIFKQFVTVLTESNRVILTEMKRQIENSNDKIDLLVDSITTLNHNHIETRKDREIDLLAMDRLDKTQHQQYSELSLISKTQGHEIHSISKTVLLLDERINSNTIKWVKLGQLIFTVAASVIAAYIVINIKK